MVNTSNKDCELRLKHIFAFQSQLFKFPSINMLILKTSFKCIMLSFKKKSNDLWLLKKQFKRLQKNKKENIV